MSVSLNGEWSLHFKMGCELFVLSHFIVVVSFLCLHCVHITKLFLGKWEMKCMGTNSIRHLFHRIWIFSSYISVKEFIVLTFSHNLLSTWSHLKDQSTMRQILVMIVRCNLFPISNLLMFAYQCKCFRLYVLSGSLCSWPPHPLSERSPFPEKLYNSYYILLLIQKQCLKM